MPLTPVKCPYKKVNLSWFTGTVNPCPGLYQPICGTNFVTYENPCILCSPKQDLIPRSWYHDLNQNQ
uniref:Kazal-like domain-containing protein n=1 Tax=Panthera leo TaxID=9689 RepID=A0A8C8X1D5_PANLE